MSEITDEPFTGLISAGIILFPLSLFELIISLHKKMLQIPFYSLLVSRVNDLIRKAKTIFKR